MGDLDGGGTGDGIAVEGQQAVLAETVEDASRAVGWSGRLRSSRLVTRRRVSSRPLDGHQTEEHLAGRHRRRSSTSRGLGAPARAPITPPIARRRRASAERSCAPLEQLGQRVLEQREPAGLLGDVGEELLDEAGLERTRRPLPAARSPLPARRGGRGHLTIPSRQQLAELRVAQRRSRKSARSVTHHAHRVAGRVERGRMAKKRRRLVAVERVNSSSNWSMTSRTGPAAIVRIATRRPGSPLPHPDARGRLGAPERRRAPPSRSTATRMSAAASASKGPLPGSSR